MKQINRTEYEEIKAELAKKDIFFDTNRIVAQHIMNHDNLKLKGKQRPIAIKGNNTHALNAGQIETVKKSCETLHFCENLDLNYVIFELIA